MFTGLVQTVGAVIRSDDDGHGGRVLKVSAPGGPPPVLGESIAVDGVCLTVTGSSDQLGVDFQVGPETVARTTLGRAGVGGTVNLERALRVGDAIGGHFVTGHVDCVGRVARREPSGEWETVWFEFPHEFDALVVMKGSVAVSGVSLTVADVRPGALGVMLIPHTRSHTTLGDKPVGAGVNLEFDLLAKHVQKLFQSLSIPA